MALYRLGDAAEARRELSNARGVLDQWAQSAYANLSTFVPTRFWRDWVECRLLYREAHQLIEKVPPAEDHRLRVVRGRAFAALGWHERAAAEYALAIEHLDRLLTTDSRDWTRWATRGHYYAELKQDEKAAADFARAIEMGADDVPAAWHPYALLCLRRGQRDQYRRHCHRLLDRFGKTESPATAWAVAVLCLHPHSGVECGRLLDLLERVPKSEREGLRGLCSLTQGRYKEAVETLERALRPGLKGQWYKVGLAEAYHRLGRDGDARNMLDEAAEWIDRQSSKLLWHQRLGLELGCRRVEQLIESRSRHARPQQSGAS